MTSESLCFGRQPPGGNIRCPCASFSFSSVFHASKNKAQTKLASLAMNPSLSLRPMGSAPARRGFFARHPHPPLATSWAAHQLTAVGAQWVKSKSHSFTHSLRRGRTGCSFNCALSVSAPRTPQIASRKAHSISSTLLEMFWGDFWSDAA